MFDNIHITINSDKAMNIFSGAINIASGFIAAIGINEIYKQIDKTGVSKGRRYLMNCGVRAVTLAAITPLITDGVKQLSTASSDKEKLITVTTKGKTLDFVTAESHKRVYDSAEMMAQKNKILEMIRGMIADRGDIHWKLVTLYEYCLPVSGYGISFTNPLAEEGCKELIAEISEYNNKMHDALGESYKFATLKTELIRAADEIAKEMSSTTDDDIK